MSTMDLCEIYNKLEEFVTAICKDRDVTHGSEHMKAVADIALDICNELNYDDIWIKSAVCIVAWLHDVLDHKYTTYQYQTTNVINFIEKDLGWDSGIVLKTTNAISFSKEKEYGMRYYEKSLGEKWTIVRDIVSDADKLLGIGNIGIERCQLFEQIMHPKKSQNEVKECVINIIKTKMIVMYEKGYFVTSIGKKRAAELHEETLQWYNKNLK